MKAEDDVKVRKKHRRKEEQERSGWYGNSAYEDEDDE